MKAIYYDAPNCYVCPAYNSGDASPCPECIKQSRILVDILRVGVGIYGDKATIAMPDNSVKTVPQYKLTLAESLTETEESK